MEDNFHTRLATELDSEHEPPLGDLVTNALRQGRQRRTVRRTTYVAGTLMTTAALITGLIVTGQSGRHAPAAIGAAHPGLSIAQSSVSKTPAPQSPVTSAAIVYRLKQILPPGTTSDYGQASDVPAWGQIALDRGHGPGVLLLHVGTVSIPYHCGDYTDPTLSIRCSTLPDGARLALIRFSDDCNQSLVIELSHANGVNVVLNVTTCLSTNGRANPPALSTAEAVAIADDPGWGHTMDSALVAAAQREFPDLPKTFK
jgi:hypothetical protein